MQPGLTRLYRYVGPPEIAEEQRDFPRGAPVRNSDDLRRALTSIAGTTRDSVTCTFVVDHVGTLRLSDRSSEHIACAGGGPAMAAGEITVDSDGAVTHVTNQSTGFCPEVECWPAVARALEAAGLEDPGGWSACFEFRRCPGCWGCSLIKEGVFECAECGRDLPQDWNFDRTLCRRAAVRLGESQWLVDSVEEPASADQDRVILAVRPGHLILALADGAGGTSGGREAAESVAAEARALRTESPTALLGRLDLHLAQTSGGQSTAVVVHLSPDGALHGASVGDSEAWVSASETWSELTDGQVRKPLLGSGRAVPEPFDHAPTSRLLVCSDGLSKYVKWDEALALLESEGADFPWGLVNAARLPSGRLQDDLSLLYARRWGTDGEVDG